MAMSIICPPEGPLDLHFPRTRTVLGDSRYSSRYSTNGGDCAVVLIFACSHAEDAKQVPLTVFGIDLGTT